MARERRSVRAQNFSAALYRSDRAWDWSDSFDVNGPRYDERPYNDHRQMKVQGSDSPKREEDESRASKADNHA